MNISKKVLSPQGNKSLDDSAAIIPAPSAFCKTSFAIDFKTGKPMSSVSAVTESLIVENSSAVLSSDDEESKNALFLLFWMVILIWSIVQLVKMIPLTCWMWLYPNWQIVMMMG